MDDEVGRLGAIHEVVRRSYESPRVVSRYLDIGLWPAEEILMADFLPEAARVLDLGCGAGRTSIALAELGLTVLGVDISEPMVQVAREQARQAGVGRRADFTVMDARQLRVPDASFDAVLYSYNGIELVPGMRGKRQVVGEVARVLVPGGRFVFCAHTLYAFNAHAPMRLRAFGRFLLGHVGVPVREQELGERFIDDEWEEAKYLQVLPPSRYRGLLRGAGLRLVYFNTRPRIESGRAWGWWSVFEDGERFFVAEKAEAAGEPADTAEVEVCHPSERSTPLDR